MEIIPSTNWYYAYPKYRKDDMDLIEEMRKIVFQSALQVNSIRGFRIELSNADNIPDANRERLIDARIFLVE